HHFPAEALPPDDPRQFGAPPSLTIRNFPRGVSRAIARRPDPGFPVAPAIMPGWDNTARRTEHAVVYAGASPALFRRGASVKWLQQIDLSVTNGRKAFVAVSHDAARAGAQIILLRLLSPIKQPAMSTCLWCCLAMALGGGFCRARSVTRRVKLY